MSSIWFFPYDGAAAYAAVGLAERTGLIVTLQLKVERGAVVAHLAFENLYGLVALHYLHLRHGLRRHVLRCLVILIAH